MDKQLRILTTKINNMKSNLTAKARKTGIYEDFGQKEVRKLENMYFLKNCNEQNVTNEVWKTIEQFNDWCMNYSLTEMEV